MADEKVREQIADDILRRIALRYRDCEVNIYPDLPELTPVEAVLRCAQAEGFTPTQGAAPPAPASERERMVDASGTAFSSYGGPAPASERELRELLHEGLQRMREFLATQPRYTSRPLPILCSAWAEKADRILSRTGQPPPLNVNVLEINRQLRFELDRLRGVLETRDSEITKMRAPQPDPCICSAAYGVGPDKCPATTHHAVAARTGKLREYKHWPWCNGNRRIPAGEPGNCCSCFNAYAAGLAARLQVTEEQVIKIHEIIEKYSTDVIDYEMATDDVNALLASQAAPASRECTCDSGFDTDPDCPLHAPAKEQP